MQWETLQGQLRKLVSDDRTMVGRVLQLRRSQQRHVYSPEMTATDPHSLTHSLTYLLTHYHSHRVLFLSENAHTRAPGCACLHSPAAFHTALMQRNQRH